MTKKRIILALIAIAVVAAAVGAGWYFKTSRNDNKQESSSSQQPSQPAQKPADKAAHLDIELKDGKLVAAPSTYLVTPGTRLEFSIKSDKLGKVGVPTNPAQTIQFTKSPLVFQFTVSNTQGDYALTYQAEGSNEVIQIGTIAVRPHK